MKEINLTDDEIVKALENCNNGLDDMRRHSCDDCPYREIEPCGKAQMTDCLDLKESVCKYKVEYEQDCENLKKSIVGRTTEILIKCKEFSARSTVYRGGENGRN